MKIYLGYWVILKWSMGGEREGKWGENTRVARRENYCILGLVRG